MSTPSATGVSGIEQWTELLDALDAQLEETRAALAAGEPEAAPADELPRPSAALPADLEDRVRDLLARTDAVATLVADDLERVREELRRLPPAEAPPTGATIDHSA